MHEQVCQVCCKVRTGIAGSCSSLYSFSNIVGDQYLALPGNTRLCIAVIRLQGELAVRQGWLGGGRREAQQAQRAIRVQGAHPGVAAAIEWL